jgi:hypothetical protein
MFEMVWGHRGEPKKAAHLALIVRQSPVKNKKIANIKRIKPQLASWDPEEFPKLTVKLIYYCVQGKFSPLRHTHSTSPPCVCMT